MVKPGEMKILHSLMDTNQGLTFTELKKITKLSAPVLSEYLATNLKVGIILKDTETRKYVIPKGYRKGLYNIPSQAVSIAISEDKNAFQEFLHYHLNRLSALVLSSILRAIKKSTQPKGRKAKAMKQIINVMEKEMDVFHASLKESLDHWINPYINYLALACIADTSFYEVTRRIGKELLEISEKNTHWTELLKEGS